MHKVSRFTISVACESVAALYLLCGRVSCVTQVLCLETSVCLSVACLCVIHITCYEYINPRNDYILLTFDVDLDSCFTNLTLSLPVCERYRLAMQQTL